MLAIEAIPDWAWTAGKAFLVLLALLGGLNAFLGLRSRWKDWRATKNKEAFDRRMKERLRDMRRITKYKTEPLNFFVDALEDAVWFGFATLGITAAYFIAARPLTVLPVVDDSALVIVMNAVTRDAFLLVYLIAAFGFLMDIYKSIGYFRNPTVLLNDVFSLFEEGKQKGWVTDEEFHKLEQLMTDPAEAISMPEEKPMPSNLEGKS